MVRRVKAFFLDYLQKAYREHFALPAFAVDNLPMLKAIVKAAELCRSPVILMVSESSVAYLGMDYIAAISRVAINRARVPVFLHFDHGQHLTTGKSMVDAGADSVMIDWSLKSIEENMRGTSDILGYAHQWGVAVEAEIGHVWGQEDDIATKEAPVSDIKDVSRFYKTCPVDLLAIAAGSVHGFYKCEPHLHFDLIEQVSKKLHVPLVLHGASGIPADQVKRAIACGICKVNIGTDVKDANVRAIRQFLVENPDCYNIRRAEKVGEGAMLKVLVDKIKMCGAHNRVAAPRANGTTRAKSK